MRAPGLFDNGWQCERHGTVAPLHLMHALSTEALQHVASRARVPLWLPEPLAAGWFVTGIGYAGDDRSGPSATVVAISGPSPLYGPADLLLVAEEPGVGLGMSLAGLSGLDPEPRLDSAPDAKVQAAGHPTALWGCPQAPDDRAAYIGEAKGQWLWAVIHPAAASLLLVEHVLLRDGRDGLPSVAFGAPTPHLSAP